MTRPDDPDAIRRDIERTQANLRTDVDALAEKVTPGRIVERRTDRMRATAGRWRDTVMGSAPGSSGRHRGSAGSGMRDTAHQAADSMSRSASQASDSLSSTAHGAADRLQAAPGTARRQTRGNPLAAGLIAFGTGWLVSSLLPASNREQELADRAQELAQEHGTPLAQRAGDAAREAAENLREPAQQAAESVRSTAQDAGSTVAQDSREQAEQVRDRAQGAADSVRETGSR